MTSRPLWKEKDQCNDDGEQDRRSNGTAQREPSIGMRLIQELADGGTQRTGKDKCRPEKEYPRNPGPE
jgi:hypothetical protein